MYFCELVSGRWLQLQMTNYEKTRYYAVPSFFFSVSFFLTLWKSLL